ncbi:uncharacterized protein BT62DRAFT_901588, partial [Guyanagaster necrorhizus]
KSNLKGLDISGSEEHLIAKLFADNTATFLYEEDFKELKKILDNWCIASGAYFNVKKTQIIPISSKEFCLRVANKWKSKTEFRQISDNIQIIKE